MQTILNNIQLFLNSDIKTFILSIIWFFSISLLLAYFLKKNQSQTYILSFVVSGLILYIGGLIKHISYAYYATWIIIAILLVILFIKKKGKEIINYIDIFGSISFVIVLFILFVIYQNVAFRYTDEFMHWGPMVREMVKNNCLYCDSSSSLTIHKDYPPFFSLVELLFCVFKGQYVEKYLYIALISFVYSIILAIITTNKKNSLLRIIDILVFTLAGLLFQFLPSAKDSIGLYNSIYIDYVLAYYVFYLFYRYINKDDNISNFESVILLSSLLLTKQISILFYAFCVVLKIIRNRKLTNNISALLIPILVFISWKCIVGINGVEGQFSLSKFSIRSEIIMIIKNYIKALIYKPLIAKPFNISFVLCALIIIALLVILKKKSRIKERELYLFIIGLCIYIGALCALYCFAFSIEEALSLASFERYVLTYIFIYVLLIISLSLSNNILTYIFIIAPLLLFADFNNSFLYKITDSKDIMVIKQWGDEIILEDPKNNGLQLNLKQRDYVDEKVSDDDLLNELSNYHYVYIYLYDDLFYQRWKEYVDNAPLENESLYLINKENNDISFVEDNFSSIYYEIRYYLHLK